MANTKSLFYNLKYWYPDEGLWLGDGVCVLQKILGAFCDICRKDIFSLSKNLGGLLIVSGGKAEWDSWINGLTQYMVIFCVLSYVCSSVYMMNQWPVTSPFPVWAWKWCCMLEAIVGQWSKTLSYSRGCSQGATIRYVAHLQAHHINNLIFCPFPDKCLHL